MTFLRRQPALAFAALLALTMCASAVRAQFEGVVESSNTTTDEYGKEFTFLMTMWVRPDRVAIHIPAAGNTPGAVIISRNDLGTRWVLNEAEKTYFVMPMQHDSQRHELRSEGSRTLTRTGKTRTILGYKAAQYVITSGGARTEIWGTAGLADLAASLRTALDGPRGEGSEEWNDELARLGVFPLEARTSVKGKVYEASRVTRIEKRAVEDARFDIPPGYTRQQNREMPQGGLE